MIIIKKVHMANKSLQTICNQVFDIFPQWKLMLHSASTAIDQTKKTAARN